MTTCLDTVLEDKSGNRYEIKICGEEGLSRLRTMYEGFYPRPASQGLPPEDPETCSKWVEGLFRIGRNLVAWKEGRVVAHASLVPDPNGKSGEFVIFVHQDFRNLGIGTALTRGILDVASGEGYESVWLTVANSNFIAIKLYKKIGFQFCDMDACERTMVIRV